ncbi:hypothetical protein ABIB86_000471 [Bradyrhizobium sp. JR1.7]|uniref:hypothetical protein n=1 Tax=unclassified Bradyrhizobium TaxID=2631580 RepID=UPI003391D072
MIEFIGSLMMITGGIIVAIALLHGDEPSITISPYENQEETADNRDLTLYDSPAV